MIVRRFFFAVFISLIFILFAPAVPVRAFDFLFGESRSPVVFDYDARVWGIVGGIGFRGLTIAPGLDTTAWFYTGGGWEKRTYYRYPDGLIYNGLRDGDNPDIDPFYRRFNIEWKFGVAQGILFDKTLDKNTLEYFIFYKGRNDIHFEDQWVPAPILFDAENVFDRKGIIQNSLLTGFSLDTVGFDTQSRLKKGVYSEVSLEAGAGFSRLNATAMAFLPLFKKVSDTGFNLISGNAATFASFDVFFGDSVPLNIRQSFGGLDPRPGLGGALRGEDQAKFDSKFKFVHNLEFRLNGPALIWPGLLFGLVVYFDYGYYNNLDGVESGFRASSGLGVFLHFFNLSSFTMYIPQILFTGPKSDGGYVTPVSLKFDLHF